MPLPTKTGRIPVVNVHRDGDHAYLSPGGPFDLTHVTAMVQAIESVESNVSGCSSVDLDLEHIDRIDGTGAVLLGQWLDRLKAGGHRTNVIESGNPKALRRRQA